MRSAGLAVTLVFAGSVLGCAGKDSRDGSGAEPETGLCEGTTVALWSRQRLGVGGTVSFNELMVHPADGAQPQWVELYNPMAIDFDLSGFRLAGAIDHVFADGTVMMPGAHALVASSADLPGAIGIFTGTLPDALGTVELWNNAGRLLDSMSYSFVEPWPIGPGGSGASLAKRSPLSSSERGENWTASTRVGGTPGADNELAPLGDGDGGPSGLAFHELPGSGVGSFWLELTNRGSAPVEIGGHVIRTLGGPETVLAGGSLAQSELLLVTSAELGFGAEPGERLFLFAPERERLLDAVRVTNLAQARGAATPGAWRHPAEVTPGAPNVFVEHDEIVINEIMYHPPPVVARDGSRAASSLEWIELFNRSSEPVDVGGFAFVDAIQFELPAGLVIPGFDYLVIAKDAAAMADAYPSMGGAAIVGDFRGSLANSGENLVLRDACGNEVDRVSYFDRGRWPTLADGGGSSLELRDPRADNSAAESWAASDEASASTWQTITYEGVAEPSPVGPDGTWQELVIGLLEDGVVLLDDVSVVADPAGAATELVTGGTFESGDASAFRRLGNHRRGEVVADPTDATNHALRLVATGPTEHMHNHLETTLAGGHTITNGLTYRISLRAKWEGGSNLLNTRLYFNRLARTTELALPGAPGTPGAPNGRTEANQGPTYRDFRHRPAVPAPDASVEVSVVAADPDDVASLTLFYAVDGGPPRTVPMTTHDGDRYAAAIPGNPAASVVQFWVVGEDAIGASSSFPASGPDSRALYQVDDGKAATNGLHNLRIVVTKEDTDWLFDDKNVMSNDLLGATVIDDESEVYYDAGLRLKSSQRGRPVTSRVGFALRFGGERPFRGIYLGVMVDRSETGGFGQREMLFNQAMNRAGSVTSQYDDLIQVLTPRPEHTGSAQLQLARFSDLMLDSQFDRGGDGMLFEYELIYYPQTTDDGTPEGNKLPQPDQVLSVPIGDLGDDREAYRWSYLLKSNRWRDDYRGLITFCQAFGQTGEDFDAKVDGVIDVDEWLRGFAFAILSGAVDNYATGFGHNANFYVRPADGRVLYFPYDLDLYSGSPEDPLVGNSDLAKLIASPARARLYYGHLYDIITTAYNRDTLTHWSDQLGSLLPGQDFAAHLQFAVERADWALNRAPDAVLTQIPRVDFAITTNDGSPLTVEGPTVTLDGAGWIDVHVVRGPDPNAPLTLSWPSETSWQATLELACGPNEIELEAFDRHGRSVGSDALAITRSGHGCP